MNPAIATALTVSGAFLASVAATWVARGWLERRQVVDAPNDRSLHRTATVRGGGVAVAGVLVVVWCALYAADRAPHAAVLVPVVGLSLVGLADDVHNLGWLPKLGLQVLVAVLFVAAYGPFSRLDLFGL